jgi:hypothetical protein
MATTWRDIDGCSVAFDDSGRVRLVVSDGVADLFDKVAAVGVDADAIVNRLIDQAQHADPASLAHTPAPARARVLTARERACRRRNDARDSRVSKRRRQHPKVFA